MGQEINAKCAVQLLQIVDKRIAPWKVLSDLWRDFTKIISILN
jgi:hypothetical protein